MSHINSSLWPPDIQATIETPREILEGQAHVLREQTRGILTAEIRVIRDDSEGRVTHCLDLIAPIRDGRHRILTTSHGTEQSYPCVVQADAEVLDPVASSDTEFRELIRQVFQSPGVKALASSLIARVRQAGPLKPAPLNNRRHKAHAKFRPAWAGVGTDDEEAGELVGLLYDEPQGID